MRDSRRQRDRERRQPRRGCVAGSTAPGGAGAAQRQRRSSFRLVVPRRRTPMTAGSQPGVGLGRLHGLGRAACAGGVRLGSGDTRWRSGCAASAATTGCGGSRTGSRSRCWRPAGEPAVGARGPGWQGGVRRIGAIRVAGDRSARIVRAATDVSGRCTQAYDVAVLDLDGVVYVGADAVAGAAEHLERARGGRDAPRLRHEQRRPAARPTWPQHLRELGDRRPRTPTW